MSKNKFCDKCKVIIPTKSSEVYCLKNVYREKEYTICQDCLDLWIVIIKRTWLQFMNKD